MRERKKNMFSYLIKHRKAHFNFSFFNINELGDICIMRSGMKKITNWSIVLINFCYRELKLLIELHFSKIVVISPLIATWLGLLVRLCQYNVTGCYEIALRWSCFNKPDFCLSIFVLVFFWLRIRGRRRRTCFI